MAKRELEVSQLAGFVERRARPVNIAFGKMAGTRPEADITGTPKF